MTTPKEIHQQHADFKNEIEELKKSYIHNSHLIQEKYNNHVELTRNADAITREIKAAEKRNHNIPVGLIQKREDLLKKAGHSLNQSNQAQKDMESLNKEISEAEFNLKTWYFPVTKKDIYAAQNEIKAIEIKINKVEVAINKEQQKDFSTHSANLSNLENEHNKLIASIALGEDNQKEADKLEKKINELTGLTAKNQSAIRKQRGIIGELNNSLNEVKNTKHQLQQQYKEIKRHFCITQAEEKAKEYILAVEKLAILKNELDFYCSGVDIKTTNENINFPQFNLTAFTNVQFSKLSESSVNIQNEIKTIVLS